MLRQEGHYGLYARNAEMCMLLPAAAGTTWTSTEKDAGSKLSVHAGITEM